MERFLTTAQAMLSGYDVAFSRAVRLEERAWRREDLSHRQFERVLLEEEASFLCVRARAGRGREASLAFSRLRGSRTAEILAGPPRRMGYVCYRGRAGFGVWRACARCSFVAPARPCNVGRVS